MRYLFAILFVGLVTCSPCFSAEPLRYNQDVRPILVEHCFGCHGRDEEAREAELRLDQFSASVEAHAIVPGKPDESELIRRIFSDDADAAMPPAGHAPLNDQQKQILRDWIQQGAEYESHWAFLPIEKPAVPGIPTKLVTWPRNDIDYFVAARLVDAQLSPSAEATTHALIRRLYLDLTGLPPTPAEVKAFLADESEKAYENLVDRLLASQHFGEHWARMWLDLARYADTKGYEKDNHRDMWRYRDWVIQAYNDDLPYDEFTQLQLGGDLLSEPSTDQILATAFHRNTMTNDEGGTDNEEFRTIAVKDRVDTTVQVWMGLTMGCAKCHSHKYDPISQNDYYRFYAFFNQTEDADRGDESPKIKSPTALEQQQIAKLKEKIDATEDADQLDALKQELAAMDKAAVSTPIMRELPEDKQRTTQVHIRGNFLDPGEEVTAAVPESFGTWKPDFANNRLGVAEWLTQQENPLTARVAVNRVWARLFGIGLVETEEDFGTQGAYPSHPELLDYLANKFQHSFHGSHKKLCKFIVTSATYRQSSHVTAAARKSDPRNRLLSHAPRFRLPGETIRDQALVAAGLLTREVGGPSVMPPQPDGVWKTTYSSAKWRNATGKNRYRRGLYTYWRRTSPYPSMLTFDAGSREVCQVRRIRTNIPLQALVTMNDPVFVEASAALAKSVLQAEGDDDERLSLAFQRVLVREPAKAELNRLKQVVGEAKQEYLEDPAAASELLEAGRVHIGGLAAGLSEIDLAAWTMVANVLLNLDETLMRN